MDEPIVFVNIGWMSHYRGPKNDPTLGGHGWLKDHDFGFEAWNFLPRAGRVFGYVPRSAQIRLRQLGATGDAQQVDGVTVVWIARSPRTGETFVVGWYRNATVHRDKDHLHVRRSNDHDVFYQIEAAESDAQLLDIEQRVFKVPTAKRSGNLGQSPVWYGNPEFVASVRQYLRTRRLPQKARTTSGSGAARQNDSEKRKRIELAAVQNAVKFFTSDAGRAYSVESVEGDRVGWDLEARSGDVTLLIEVKGLTGRDLCVELTPNEYEKMIAPKHRPMYVVYVVTEAATLRETRHIFYYNRDASSGKKHVWMSDDGRALDIQARTGARLTLL